MVLEGLLVKNIYINRHRFISKGSNIMSKITNKKMVWQNQTKISKNWVLWRCKGMGNFLKATHYTWKKYIFIQKSKNTHRYDSHLDKNKFRPMWFYLEEIVYIHQNKFWMCKFLYKKKLSAREDVLKCIFLIILLDIYI